MLRGPATTGIRCNLDVAHVEYVGSSYRTIKSDLKDLRSGVRGRLAVGDAAGAAVGL